MNCPKNKDFITCSICDKSMHRYNLTTHEKFKYHRVAYINKVIRGLPSPPPPIYKIRNNLEKPKISSSIDEDFENNSGTITLYL